MEAVQEDLRASDRARAEERRCEAVRVEVSDCSSINCGAVSYDLRSAHRVRYHV